MIPDYLPGFGTFGLDCFKMFPPAYDGFDAEYICALEQLWAVREGLAPALGADQ